MPEGEPKEIAEKFITFFTNKIKKITETFTPTEESQARNITTRDKELASFALGNVENLKKKKHSERKLNRVTWIQFQHGL